MNYYALLVVLILLTSILMGGNREHNKKYVIVACSLLFIIYGLRDTYRIGGDTTSSYIGVFEKMHAASWAGVLDYSGGTNVGFYLMTKAFSEYIRYDYQLYISLISLFVTVCFARLIYRYSPSPVQSILYHFGLLLFTFHFSALKQSIAMAILMLAFDQLVERKPVKFILIVLLAGQFHLPSLAFLPAYWITKVKPGRAFLVVLGIVLLLTYLFRNQLINLLNSMYKDTEGEADLSGITFLRTKALIMVIIVAAAFFFRMPVKEDVVYNALLEMMGIAIVFQTFCGYSNNFERLADYYFQFSVVFIPMVFDRNADRKTLFNWRFIDLLNTASPFLFCSFAIYRFVNHMSSLSWYSPYRFFFQ